MTQQPEEVVLLDDAGTPIGTRAKSEVHTRSTPLHLAFSCYVFDDQGRLLITRRALAKQTWPGVWSNSFCGHPLPGEALADAVARRALDELGAPVTRIRNVLPDFHYRAVDASGIVENEQCPVFTAELDGELAPADSEICDWSWIDPADLVTSVDAAPFVFSPWMGLQLPQLEDLGALRREPAHG